MRLVACALLVMTSACSERIPVPFERPPLSTHAAMLSTIPEGLHIVSSQAELQRFMYAPDDRDVVADIDWGDERLAILVWMYSGCSPHEPGMLGDLFLDEDDVLHALNLGGGGVRCNLLQSLWDAVSFGRDIRVTGTRVVTE